MFNEVQWADEFDNLWNDLDNSLANGDSKESICQIIEMMQKSLSDLWDEYSTEQAQDEY